MSQQCSSAHEKQRKHTAINAVEMKENGSARTEKGQRKDSCCALTTGRVLHGLE